MFVRGPKSLLVEANGVADVNILSMRQATA
jgi:hypothetical protein